MTLDELYTILSQRAYELGERKKLIDRRASFEKQIEILNQEIVVYDNKIEILEKKVAKGT